MSEEEGTYHNLRRCCFRFLLTIPRTAKGENGPPKKRGRPKKEDAERYARTRSFALWQCLTRCFDPVRRSNRDQLIAVQAQLTALKTEVKELKSQLGEIKQVIVNLTTKQS